MKRLGENVFQFAYGRGNIFAGSLIALIIVGCFFIALLSEFSLRDFSYYVFFLLLLSIIIILLRISFRNYKAGVILDNERNIVVLHKWTWSLMGKINFEEIPMSEIMGTQRDVDVTTTTKYISGKWDTSESRSYNIVLQGKFGSKRFRLAYGDDWNLFMTLLYGEQ